MKIIIAILLFRASFKRANKNKSCFGQKNLEGNNFVNLVKRAPLSTDFSNVGWYCLIFFTNWRAVQRKKASSHSNLHLKLFHLVQAMMTVWALLRYPQIMGFHECGKWFSRILVCEQKLRNKNITELFQTIITMMVVLINLFHQYQWRNRAIPKQLLLLETQHQCDTAAASRNFLSPNKYTESLLYMNRMTGVVKIKSISIYLVF